MSQRRRGPPPGQRGRGGAQRPPPRSRLEKIPAPYGFVPLNPRVVLPDWGSAASRDIPFEDGMCGTMALEIEANSPIFVRGTSADYTAPFCLPDGQYALPGSSVRGMLRNVVEIATFGKLLRVNDHRFPLRDLHNRESYGRHMAQIVNRQPVPLVNAGWLIPANADGTEATIIPCHFAKIEYARLKGIARSWGAPKFDPGAQQSAVVKYQALLGEQARHGQRLPPLHLKIETTPRPVPGLRSNWGRVVGDGDQLAHLVMTGQPSPYRPDRPQRRGGGHPKHHDFVFHFGRTGQPVGAPIPVSKRALQDFEFAHADRGKDRGQQGSLNRSVAPNVEWGFWRERVFPGAGRTVDHARFAEQPQLGVPVFFLLDKDGLLRAMGLAMMFRLAAQHSVRDTISRVQKELLAARPDFAETLFGRVADEHLGDGARQRDASDAKRDHFGLAGRVSIGVARAEQGVEPGPKKGPLVLGTPKASYYPNYLEQGAEPGASPPVGNKGRPRYTTWMEDRAVPRGWKRYRPIEGHALIDPPTPTDGKGREIDLEKVGTEFHPLPPGTRFTATIRLHNVRPVELGALLWAIDHGGAQDTFHKLGMARSLGYGTVSLTASRTALERNDGTPVDRSACIAAFRTYMDGQWAAFGGDGTWETSRTVQELVALARPQPVADSRHMRLDPGSRINEFVDAKKAGLALRAATRDGGRFPIEDRPQRGHQRASSGDTPRATPPTRPSRVEGLPSAGDRIRVALTEQNKKGRWRVRWLDGEGKGTIVGGTEPAHAAADLELEVRVKRASSRIAMELEWT